VVSVLVFLPIWVVTFAYEVCKILHRDISPWNILLLDQGAFLLDWELCKHYNEGESLQPLCCCNIHIDAVCADGTPLEGPWREGRTGTWQFMRYAHLLPHAIILHSNYYKL
jgi:hypothetical protein